MENKKLDLKTVIAAGKKVIAKIKNTTTDKIIAYNGSDSYYTDNPEYDNFEITPEGYAVPKISAKDRFQDFITTISKKQESLPDYDDEVSFDDETPMEYESSENAFNYYEKILSKLDALKDRGNDSINEFMKKAENLFKSDTLTKQQLADELDTLMVELDDKLGQLMNKSDDTTKAIETLTNQSKSNFESLSSSLDAVSGKSTEMLETLAQVGAVLKKSEAKIDEIHEASMGIDKLVDSVFELKNASLQARDDIADIKKKQKFIKIWSIIAASVIGAMAIAALTIQIITLVL